MKYLAPSLCAFLFIASLSAASAEGLRTGARTTTAPTSPRSVTAPMPQHNASLNPNSGTKGFENDLEAMRKKAEGAQALQQGKQASQGLKANNSGDKGSLGLHNDPLKKSAAQEAERLKKLKEEAKAKREAAALACFMSCKKPEGSSAADQMDALSDKTGAMQSSLDSLNDTDEEKAAKKAAQEAAEKKKADMKAAAAQKKEAEYKACQKKCMSEKGY